MPVFMMNAIYSKPFKENNKLIINIEYDDSFLASNTNKAAVPNGQRQRPANQSLDH